MLDETDCKILKILMGQGRSTWADLAEVVQLSAPAVADRVRRLEERGVIVGYGAIAQPEAVGMTLLAYVAVTLERPEHRAPFLELVQNTPEIQECHHIAGDDDYWLKVRCRHTQDLERLLSDRLKALPGLLRTRTTIVLSTVKETTVLPLSLG